VKDEEPVVEGRRDSEKWAQARREKPVLLTWKEEREGEGAGLTRSYRGRRRGRCVAFPLTLVSVCEALAAPSQGGS
jgi:hypothetical protein